MLLYNSKLKKFSQKLRKNQTDAERKIWRCLRKNQIANMKFSRQKPIGKYIVDFYCHQLKLIIELDGDQHFYEKGKERDNVRNAYLKSLGLKIIRVPNNEIFKNLEGVIQNLWNIAGEKPSQPPFKKGRSHKKHSFDS